MRVDGREIDYSGLPENHRETVRGYLEAGLAPGSGWAAILRGDLMAVLMVDQDTMEALPQILRWLHNRAPGGCWGTAERYHSWMAERRLERNLPTVRQHINGMLNAAAEEGL